MNLFNNDFDQSSDGIYIQIPFTIDPSNLDNEDPLFVDPDNDDFHLTEDSPCKDAGTDAGVYDDIDGDPRPLGAGHDIGADEYIECDIFQPSPDWCRVCGPCSEGQGDCDGDSECESGLICAQDVGENYGWPPGWDVCEQPPTINFIENDSGVEGTAYTGPTPSLSQGTLPVTWSLKNGPSGMTIISSTGVVSWSNPTVAGSPHSITIRATNSAGYDDESWQLTVTPAPPIINPIDNDTVVGGTVYTGPTPILSQGTLPVAWSLENGPSGMNINGSTGVVSWSNPTVAGSPHSITIRATNSAGYDDESWQLTVTPAPNPPIINSIDDDSVGEGTAYTGPTPSLSQGTLPVTWSLENGPGGMTISSSTGAVSWSNPTVTGSPHSITIKATNIAGSDTENWQLSVNPKPGVLSVNPTDGLITTGVEGGPFSPSSKAYTLANTGGDLISWTASEGETWVTLSSNGGTLAAGTNTSVTVSINSGANSLETGSYSDTVSFTNTSNGNGNTTISVNLTVKEAIIAAEIIGSWDSGIWHYDVSKSKWTKMTSGVPFGDIAAGDFTGDDKADVASCWDSGLWYQDGTYMDWIKIDSSPPFSVTAGDVTGDGSSEIIGTWDSGIWYWNEASSKWTKMTSFTPTGDIAAGDFTGDGKADVASCWKSGLWFQNGATLGWTKVSSKAPDSVTASDITGDSRAEIIGTWDSGVWYWDEAASKWTQMYPSTPTGEIAAGDFNGDGKADVASCWSNGLWYQDGATLNWTKVSNTAPTQLTAGDVTGD